ncbi:MAG: GH3 auxin-responsive promoter family protein [Crocinitomicaceae bacterium]|nr:GH3 auxin-responsive promoter family protein [Crocinitomicaceae bacterium]
MSVLGSIVKMAVEVNQKLHFLERSPEDEQAQQLIDLLSMAQNTSFGKYYGFTDIIRADDPLKAFQKNIPIHNYKDMHFWWKQQQRFPDITWPGKPEFFALTSGTTGNKPKRTPVTKEFVDSMRDVASSVARSLPNFDLPPEIFESRVLMLSSSAKLKKHEDGHLEGEISGININNFPGWYDLFYAPGFEIANIDNWEERIERIVEMAPEWNIGAIAGIPSWVLIMLKAIMKKYELEYIQDIWPDFQVYASGGVAYETYREDFQKLSNKELIIIDTYLASEGFFAHTARPNTMAMRLALGHGYFYEFIPFDERGVDERGNVLDNPEIHTIKDIEKDQEYVLVVTTTAGAWRYIIGDTIKFTALHPHEIIITGRIKFFLNVAGSQLSEEKMDLGIQHLSEKIGHPINEYMVAGVKNQEDEYIHQWVLVCENGFEEKEAAEILDRKLSEINKNYGVARNKALKDIVVKRISKEMYNDYLESHKKKGGQAKIPKVMDQEQMKELLAFIH